LNNLKYISFVINETPYAYWGYNLKEENINFLKSIDSEYLNYTKFIHVPNLEKEDNLRASIAILIAYHHALELLFSLLCSLIQQPIFSVGWLLSYKNFELKLLVDKISQNKSIYSKLNTKNVNWSTISELVFSYFPDNEKKDWLIKIFGNLWFKLAKDFTDDKNSQEYNSIKHGFRAALGGTKAFLGAEEIIGTPAPIENMKVLGDDIYGTSYNYKSKLFNIGLKEEIDIQNLKLIDKESIIKSYKKRDKK